MFTIWFSDADSPLVYSNLISVHMDDQNSIFTCQVYHITI